FGHVQMFAAAVSRAQSSSVHQKELSADLGGGCFLRVGWRGEQRGAAGAFATERVEVEQDCRHDFGHDVGIDDKRGHEVFLSGAGLLLMPRPPHASACEGEAWVRLLVSAVLAET